MLERRITGAGSLAVWALVCGCAALPEARPKPAPSVSVPDRVQAAGDGASATRPQPRETSVEFALELVLESELALAETLGLPNPAPGSLWLLVRLRPPPGQHLYWKNPGGTGLETRAEVLAPGGFRASEVLYPGPSRFRSERGTVSYGYAAETALFVLLERLPHADHRPPTVDVVASWLSCDHMCRKEGLRSSVTLGERPSGKWVQADVLAQRLPQPFPTDGEVMRVSSGQLHLRGPKDTQWLEFFPETPATGAFQDVVHLSPHTQTLVVMPAPGQALSAGVVRAIRDGRDRWYQVPVVTP